MFVIEIPCMSLKQIYDSMQVPRWIKLRDDKYIVIHKDKALKIEQVKERFIMNCSEDEFFNLWFNYFNLDADYVGLNFKAKQLSSDLKVMSNRGKGIHIVEHDAFEFYVYTKLVEYVGYTKAKVALNHIAKVCGTKHVQAMREAGKVTWYEFPTPEMILNNFDCLGKMGKVNKWLKRLCEAIIYEDYDYSFHGNWNELCKLYMNNNIDVFPKQGVEEYINEMYDCDVDCFIDLFLDESENKGLIYMYMLHHILNPPKEITHGTYR